MDATASARPSAVQQDQLILTQCNRPKCAHGIGFYSSFCVVLFGWFLMSSGVGFSEAEHGYASTMPVPNDLSRKRSKSKKSQGSRYQEVLMTLARKQKTTHNELEKNRRAHLRNCLEKLKDIVPLGPESSRHTTLGLLTKAKGFIKTLEDRDRRQQQQKDQLLREQRYLRRRLDQLEVQYGGSGHKRRSLSECSSSTSISTNSCTSETDEVDIMGYNSNQSDTDDHSSIQSLNSDGGVAISTKRLTLLEAVSI